MIDALQIIARHYTPGSELHSLLVAHSSRVAALATRLGRRLAECGVKVDLAFVDEAAMLHDIGIVRTFAPGIHCHGELPYIAHGIAGRQMLDALRLHRHALVCERHTGAGITVADIDEQHLPLPRRDMVPVSVEERLVCYADKFFSKTRPTEQKTLEQARRSLAKFGDATLQRFEALVREFGDPATL